MSEISGGEVNGSDVHGDGAGGEVQEVNEHAHETDKPMDDDLAKEVNDNYDSYMEDKDLSSYERKGPENRGDASEEADGTERGEVNEADQDVSETAEQKNTELTPELKAELKEETGWSDELIDSARSLEETEVYKNANLKETEINGKKCLIREDIDMSQKDEFGRTNLERIQNGNAPLTKEGQPIELHHIGQKQESPLAELTMQEHRGKGNDTILHDKQKDTEIDRNEFAKERRDHWKSRGDNIS